MDVRVGLVGSPCSPRDPLKSLLQHHSSKASILQCSAFFVVQLSHPCITTGKTIARTKWTFAGKVMSLLFNMLSGLVIAVLPRSKSLLILWLQSPSAVILEPKKIKSDTETRGLQKPGAGETACKEAIRFAASLPCDPGHIAWLLSVLWLLRSKVWPFFLCRYNAWTFLSDWHSWRLSVEGGFLDFYNTSE